MEYAPMFHAKTPCGVIGRDTRECPFRKSIVLEIYPLKSQLFQTIPAYQNGSQRSKIRAGSRG